MTWFRGYRLGDLRIDALSGLTVALVLIPQSMAYAQLAGLPPFYGLYASFLPPVIAALFGSSRQLATGPVAVVSLMTNASLAPLATAGSQEYIAYAILLALLVGAFQFLLGVLRLGLVVNFLSHPVVNGFTNAAALIIATSQLSKMFGVYVDNAPHHVETIILVCKAAINYTHWPTLIMGLLAFGIMYGLKWLNPRIPFVLVAVAVTTLASWLIGFEQNRTVAIQAIADPAAVARIGDYNQTVTAIDPLARQRTQINQEIEEARAGHDEIAVLDALHKSQVISARIEHLKKEAGRIRAEIRDMLFQAEALADGGLRFYRKGTEQPVADGDGRTWRIKVGSFALKPEQLLMMGGGAVVGRIPSGLPAFSMPALNLKVMAQLLPYAVIISLLGFMEAISIAKAMAAKTGQRLDPNQELIGQGLSNVLGAMGKSYPVSGSFSRSAVNLQAGAVTGISSAFTSLAVVIVLLFFHAPALPPAPGGPGRSDHDGRHRPAQHLGLHSCLACQVVRRGDFGNLLSGHPGLRPPFGQGDHDRGGPVVDRFSLQKHAPFGGHPGPDRRQRPALRYDLWPGRMQIHRHGALRWTAVFRQRHLSGRQNYRNHVKQTEVEAYHHRVQRHQRHRCLG